MQLHKNSAQSLNDFLESYYTSVVEHNSVLAKMHTEYMAAVYDRKDAIVPDILIKSFPFEQRYHGVTIMK